MRCHSVQALWASTPPAHHVVTMVATHNPPSLWTGGSCGDLIVWKLPSRPPDADHTSNQDLLPMALLCGHTASIVALVTCGLDEMKRTGGYATHVSMMNKDFGEPSSCEVIVSGCSDGWLCAWDCLTRRCRQRRKLPQWLGSPNSMTSLLGTKRYVAIAFDGCDSRITATDKGDTNMKKLVDNARTMAWERFGSTNKYSKITVVIVDTSVLEVVRVVCSGLFGVAPVRAIAAVPEADSLHKIMVSDPAGHIQTWKVSLEGEEMDGAAAGEQDKHLTALPLQDETETVEDTKTVCFSPDGSYVLLVFGTKWVIVLTEDQSVVYQFLKGESKYGNADWAGGRLFPASSFPGWMLLIWDAHGGATLFSLHTSETLAAEEVCWIPPFQTDVKLFICFEYHPLLNSLLCVASGHISFPTPNVWVRLWLLPRSFMPFSGLRPADPTDNDVSGKQVSCRLYACGDLRTPWESLASSRMISGESVCEGMHLHNLHEKSVSCSFGTEWVTASMVLFDKVAIPRALVLGFSNGVIKLIGFRTSLQDGERGLLVEKSSIQGLHKHIGPIICLAEHKMSSTVRGTQKYLLSGGMDCLTCIWNLNTGGQLLMTLHHHVTPVHQILLPPPSTYSPWSNCFITVGEDGCIALISLETLQVERMFVGHPTQPKQITWDGIRGYLSCLCSNISTLFKESDAMFVWDMKSGALERILRGAAAHSMYTNFAQQLQGSTLTNGLSKIQTSSTSSLLHGEVDSSFAQSADKSQTFGPNLRRKTESDTISVLDSKQSTDEMILRQEISSSRVIGGLEKLSLRLSQALNQGAKAALSEAKDSSSGISRESSSRNLFHKQPPIKGASPIAGVVALQFDLFTLMAPDLGRMGKNERESEHSKVQGGNKATGHSKTEDITLLDESLAPKSIELELASALGSTEGCLLRSCLAFLHLWGADKELDKCLQEEWKIMEPSSVHSAPGFAGDKGATTLLLPGWESTFEMWTLSAEFCALRSLTLVATALRMATLCRHTCNANSALAAFYTRGLAELFPKVKAPSLELYACFWQDPSEHVRMAARSLFHCAVSRAIPAVLRARGSPGVSRDETGHMEHGYINTADSLLRLEQKLVMDCAREKPTWPDSISPSAEIIDWLESYESKPWTEVVEGTIQDARAGRIIVASALAVWYPGLVKPELAPSVAPYLVKLVKAMVDRHSAVAAELLGDGMESVWRHLIADEIPQLICDVFLLIECLSGGGATKSTLTSNPATAMTIRETLTGSLLPSLAMTDVASFLQIMQIQLSSASASSSEPLVTLMTTIRIIRGAPRVAVFHLSQVMSIILQTMNTGRHCHQTAMAAIREMVRVYPMVALHQSSGKLAVGDAAGSVHSLAIHVYDLNSTSKIRDLDASGPPGHPALLLSDADGSLDAGGISALAFSEDGEGVVAFSQHGLMIRWWSLAAVWWEKLSRVHPPLQCNKLVLVPPWSGFSPKSSRSSIMATISNSSDMHPTVEESRWHQHEDTIARADRRSIDLSFKIEWKSGRIIALLHHGQELGVFQM